MTNGDKAKNMTKGFLKEGLIKKSRIQELLIKAMDWKDEQYKKNNSIFINYLKEWAQGWLIEQLTDFAQHLNKRGAFL